MNLNIFKAIGEGLQSLGTNRKTERETYEDDYEFGRFRQPATPQEPTKAPDVVLDLRQPVYAPARNTKKRSVRV